MVGIIDYGVGNLFSVCSSLRKIGEDACIVKTEDEIQGVDRIILPGVGAFGDAAQKLRANGLDEALIKEARDGKPLMGICLGMQLLFDKSHEYGEHDGLALICGDVITLEGKIPPDLKTPHIGWNALKFVGKNPLFKYINDGDFVYFVHSYFATDCLSDTIATAEYGIDVTAAVAKDNVFGCQFHPEKSGDVGLKILKGFCEV